MADKIFIGSRIRRIAKEKKNTIVYIGRKGRDSKGKYFQMECYRAFF